MTNPPARQNVRLSLAGVSYLWKVVKPDAGLFWRAQLFLFTEMGLSIFPALPAKPLFDQGLLKGNVRLVAGIVSLQLLLYSLSLLLSKMWDRCFLKIGTRAHLRVASPLYENIHGHSLSFFINTTPSEISQRLTSDPAAFESIYKIFGQGLFAFFKIIIVAMVMLAYNLKMALVAFIFYPCIIALSYLASRKSREMSAAQVSASIDIGNHVYQTLNINGYLLLTATEAWRKSIEQFNSLLEKAVGVSYERQSYSFNIGLLSNWLSYAGVLLVYMYGAHFISNGEFTLGSLMTFILLAGYLRQPAVQLSEYSPVFMECYSYICAVREFSGRKPAILPNPDGKKIRHLRHSIELKNVDFSYNPGNPVVKDVSFSLRPGKLTALLGHNGAGKTTLAYLIMRFFDPDNGEILLDDSGLKQYEYPGFRDVFYYLPQDNILFNKSVRENLLVSSPSASEDDIVEACKKARLLEKIESLPMGFDTAVGESGYSFSGGERQKINLARIFLRKPRVLILDEPTSSMDPFSEVFLTESIRGLCDEGASVLMITHKMQLAKNADEILVMNKGCLEQKGTHSALALVEGLYKEMCLAQG